MQQNFHHRSSHFLHMRFSLLALALALCLFLPLSLRAQNGQNPPPQNPVSQPTLRLSDVHGSVQVYRGDLLAFPQAYINMPIVEGMRIVTGNSGRAEIQFTDGSVARLAPNSSLLVSSLGGANDGILTARLRALTGLTYYEFNTQGNQYSLAIGQESVIPSGNAVIRVDMDNLPYQLADMQGGLQLLNGNNFIVSLQSGQTVNFNPSDPEMYQLSDSVPPNSWDQWNANRDADLAQLASASSQSESSDNSAWNELNAYGDWYSVPGYGEGWAPSGVSSSWDPYGYGWWGYYPSWGYTWISGYPWGWWPYHCGYWNWFTGPGWMWFPGNCGWGGFGGAWYPTTYIQSVPPHYHRLIRPVRPAHGPRQRVPRVYPVNRGNQFAGVFHRFNGSKPSPRSINYNGHTLHPVQAALPAMQFAPVAGEGNTITAQRAHPGGAVNRGSHGQPIRTPYRVGSGNPGAFHPAGGAHFNSQPRHAPFFHPGNNGGQHMNSAPRSGPVFHSAPRSGPVFHSPPRVNSGPRPGPVFHPAPMPRPAPMPHSSFHAPAFHPAPAPHPAGHPHR